MTSANSWCRPACGRGRGAAPRGGFRVLGRHDDAHQITSSSAVSAPADFIACRIASRSCGVAPSELSALTTSASLVPGAICTSDPGCWVIVMSDFSVTVVCPTFANGPGWLTEGVVLIVTERLPCATAHAAIVTAWFMTIDPV